LYISMTAWIRNLHNGSSVPRLTSAKCIPTDVFLGAQETSKTRLLISGCI
jgi:hypothetical protein